MLTRPITQLTCIGPAHCIALLFFHQQPCDAARRIATGLNLAPIDIQDAHEDIRSRVSCRFDDNQLICTDTRLRIADMHDLLVVGAI
jgi:hypothetical protein